MRKLNIRWKLVAYDFFIFAVVEFFLLFLLRNNENLSLSGAVIQAAISFACVFSARFLGRIYQQIWRYGGVQCYIRLFVVDGCAFILNMLLEIFLPIEYIAVSRLLAISCMNLLCTMAMRMMYRYAFKCGNTATLKGRLLNFLLHVFAGTKIESEKKAAFPKIKIAIIGAGRTGVALAEELLGDETSAYLPRCFIDVNKSKVDRTIQGIPVFQENEAIFECLEEHEVQEVVFAMPNLSEEKKKHLYDYYSQAGYDVKSYDYPMIQNADGKRHLREFSIEELLFRKPIDMHNERTNAYYREKIILITGGGGSIGSELCRQIAKMQPKQIIIFDIYENGAYNVQQELRMVYGDTLNIQIEIASITNKYALERVFVCYRPQIVIHAAAHKHVPLMEHNCIEAVENNVFGTKNLVDLCEAYNVQRFMMVSSDKAVNPTNVMGATKRMCELLVHSASTYGKVSYSTTRFGNVLGSAGSVIPIFKNQIANGGPITITDKRIIRYFMTIPEASQLVLQSGAMAKNGELFVLDMGQPVKILDLAENMIRLSGVRGIEIIETGLRPGEKLYEELLIKTEELDSTENSLIFIERESPVSKQEIDNKLDKLKKACDSGDDDLVRDILMQVIPTYKEPNTVNLKAEEAEEMKIQKELVTA